jgi:sugar phosphate isomerase/epimerase
MARRTDPSDRAAPGISQFLVQVHGEERGALLDYAVEQGYGVDLSEFISQHLLDDGPRCAELVAWYRNRLPDVPGPVTLHGALWDMAPSARDSKVRAATMERMRQCLDIAEELGIDWVNLHLDFFPLAKHPDHFGQWTERQAAFWRELLQGRSVTVLLENVWEPTPEIARAAVDAVGMCTGIATVLRANGSRCWATASAACMCRTTTAASLSTFRRARGRLTGWTCWARW